MAVVKQKKKRVQGIDTEAWIMPAMPVHNIGMRYFVSRAKRTGTERTHLKHHGLAGGCGATLTGYDAGTRLFQWEQEVYRDAEGVTWIRDSEAIHRNLNGWRLSPGCEHCADSPLERLYGERFAWQEQGLCFGSRHPGFFSQSGTANVVKEAKRLCAACSVQPQCKQWARDVHAATLGGIKGIWGGETESERNAHQQATT